MDKKFKEKIENLFKGYIGEGKEFNLKDGRKLIIKPKPERKPNPRRIV